MTSEAKEYDKFLELEKIDPQTMTSRQRNEGLLKQIFISFIAITGGISSGMVIGFSSVTLPQLTNATNTDQIFLTPDQASWFASTSTLISAIGCLLCGPISDRFGRKISLLVLHMPSLLGWTLLATVTKNSPDIIAQLYLGRVFSGLTAGMSSIPATVYLAEIASNTKIRSMLMAWTSISITLGVFIVYVLGSLFRDNWQMIAVICGILPLLALSFTYFFLPESPLWLISKDRSEEALTSLRCLRGVQRGEPTPLKVQSEYDGMIELHEAKRRALLTANQNKLLTEDDEKNMQLSDKMPLEDLETKEIADNTAKEDDMKVLRCRSLSYYFASPRATLAALCRREALKPLLIMNGLFLFQQISGYIVITYYSVDLLLKAGVSVDPYLATILLGMVQFLSGVAVSFVLTRCGRRPMGIIGGTGLAMCMIGLGLNMQFKWFSSWFPLTVLTALVVFSMIGFRTVPWTILGEIYPLNIKGVAVGITTCNMYIFSFATVKLYPLLLGILNSTEGIFYFYGVSSTLGTIFVILFQPETHRKSLEQIQIDLHQGRKSRSGTSPAISHV